LLCLPAWLHNKELSGSEAQGILSILEKYSHALTVLDDYDHHVKAKLKIVVKRLLRQYGYPPDMQLLATETVLKQAEMIANELAIN